MRLCVFALHDTAIKAFAQPFFMASEAAAIRAFRSLVNDRNSSVNQSPGDYSLHFLGTFDDTHGTFTCDKTRQIATGLSVYNAGPADPAQLELAPSGNGAYNSENLSP